MEGTSKTLSEAIECSRNHSCASVGRTEAECIELAVIDFITCKFQTAYLACDFVGDQPSLILLKKLYKLITGRESKYGPIEK